MKLLQSLLFSLLITTAWTSLHAQLIISADTTWDSNQVITQSVIVNSNVKLRIESGVDIEIQFVDADNDSCGDIKFEVNGTLVINGQPCDEVEFKPQGAPQFGHKHWKGIQFSSNSLNDTLQYFKISNADSGLWTGGPTTIKAAEVFNSGTGIVALPGSDLNIVDCQIHDNVGSGIQNYGGQMTLFNSEILRNGKFGVSSQGGFTFVNTTNVDTNIWGGIYAGSGVMMVDYSNIRANGGAGFEISEWVFNNDFDTAATMMTTPQVSGTNCNIHDNASSTATIPDSIVRNWISYPTPWGDCTGGNPALGNNQCSVSSIFELPLGSLDSIWNDVSHVWNHVSDTHYAMVYYLEEGYQLPKIDSFFTTNNGTVCDSGATEAYVLETSVLTSPISTDKYRLRACGLATATTQRPTFMNGVFQMRLGGYEVNSTVAAFAPMDFKNNYWGQGAGIQSLINEVDTINVDFSFFGGLPLSNTGPTYNNGLPVVNLGADSVLCPGQMVTLDAGNPGASYAWSTGDSTKILDSLFQPGTYYVDVTNACGTSSDTMVVTHNTPPTVGFTGDTLLCQGESSTLQANGAATYEWDNGAVTGPIATITPPVSTSFQLEGTDINGCKDTVIVNLTVTNVDTTVMKTGDTLTATGSGSFQWLNCDSGYAAISGDTNAMFTTNMTGNYAVSVTENGCTDTSSCYSIVIVGREELKNKIHLQVYPNPAGEILNLKADGLNGGYQWNIVDTYGRIILSGHQTNQIEIADLANGLYILRLQTAKQNASVTFIKE